MFDAVLPISFWSQPLMMRPEAKIEKVCLYPPNPWTSENPLTAWPPWSRWMDRIRWFLVLDFLLIGQCLLGVGHDLHDRFGREG